MARTPGQSSTTSGTSRLTRPSVTRHWRLIGLRGFGRTSFLAERSAWMQLATYSITSSVRASIDGETNDYTTLPEPRRGPPRRAAGLGSFSFFRGESCPGVTAPNGLEPPYGFD